MPIAICRYLTFRNIPLAVGLELPVDTGYLETHKIVVWIYVEYSF